MSHEWSKGVLTASSWHGLEEVGEMPDADSMIRQGEHCGAWPIKVDFDKLLTAGGLSVPGRAVVADYANGHPSACLSVVGNTYRATSPEEWRTLVRAATAAGGRPTGAFSLRDGTRSLATFEVGTANGLRTQLLLADAFDGSMKLTCGTTSIRVVCANTLSASLSKDGDGMAKLRHTKSLEEKVAALAETIGVAIARGDKVRSTYHAAEELRLHRDDAMSVFDLLFPRAEEKADQSAKTRARNERREAEAAMQNPVNDCGNSLATLWNAATFLVDRTGDGRPRSSRGGDPLDSILFGQRAKRVEEIQTIIEVIMSDGRIQSMPATKALEAGVDARSVGRSVIDEMLGDLQG